MATKTIAHPGFSYRIEASDPAAPGEVRYRRILAFQGDTVDIPLQDDIDRGERFGAFVSAAEEAATEPTNPADMTPDELFHWFRNDRPQAAELVALAAGDPAFARRLLTAEYTTGSRHAEITALYPIVASDGVTPTTKRGGK